MEESVYGEEYLSQLSVAAQVSDEDDDSNKFNEASRCDPDPTSLTKEFEESSNCENENEQDGSGEGEEDETKIPKRCACSKRCFLLFEQKQQLIIEYRRNLAEFTKDENDILLLTKLEHMEHSEEQTRRGKKTCQRFNYSFQGHQICESTWRFIHDIGELITME